MKMKDALLEYFVQQKLREEGDTSEDWFRDSWYRVAVGGRKVPVYPLWGLKKSLTACRSSLSGSSERAAESRISFSRGAGSRGEWNCWPRKRPARMPDG